MSGPRPRPPRPARNAGPMFYAIRMRERGFPVDFVDWRDLEKGRRVLASEDEVHERIESRYDFKIEDSWHNVCVYRVLGNRVGGDRDEPEE